MMLNFDCEIICLIRNICNQKGIVGEIVEKWRVDKYFGR